MTRRRVTSHDFKTQVRVRVKVEKTGLESESSKIGLKSGLESESLLESHSTDIEIELRSSKPASIRDIDFRKRENFR